MIELLKAFGRGVLYIVCFPFFVVAIVLFGVIGLLAFVFQIIKSVIFFFTGQKFFPELPEDRELRLRREAEEAKKNAAAQAEANPQVAVPNGVVFQALYSDSANKEEPTPVVVFPIPQATTNPEPSPVIEPVKEAPQVKEEIVSEGNKEDEEDGSGEPEQPVAPIADEPAFVEDDESTLEDILNTENVIEEPEEEELEEYKPKETDNSLYVDDEDDDGSSGNGVDINFDD